MCPTFGVKIYSSRVMQSPGHDSTFAIKYLDTTFRHREFKIPVVECRIIIPIHLLDSIGLFFYPTLRRLFPAKTSLSYVLLLPGNLINLSVCVRLQPQDGIHPPAFKTPTSTLSCHQSITS